MLRYGGTGGLPYGIDQRFLASVAIAAPPEVPHVFLEIVPEHLDGVGKRQVLEFACQLIGTVSEFLNGLEPLGPLVVLVEQGKDLLAFGGGGRLRAQRGSAGQGLDLRGDRALAGRRAGPLKRFGCAGEVDVGVGLRPPRGDGDAGQADPATVPEIAGLLDLLTEF